LKPGEITMPEKAVDESVAPVIFKSKGYEICKRPDSRIFNEPKYIILDRDSVPIVQFRRFNDVMKWLNHVNEQ
jgi:hypothetical protein